MSKITVIGLGAGDLKQMPLGIYERISRAGEIFLRTEKHPVVEQLKAKGIIMHSYDAFYEREEDFARVYEAIADDLLQQVKKRTGEIVFAVPGHPLVAEKTTQLLLERAPLAGVDIEVAGGHSFLDPMFAALHIDPVEGFVLLDGLTLHRRDINPWLHLIITQIYDRFTASDVKLTLMEVFPDEYPVTLVLAAGVEGQQQVQSMPLHELDHVFQEVQQLAAVYVPPAADEAILNRQFSTLREIVAILRSPEGCPWDREQTHQSIRKHLLEETYEVLETIDDDDPEAMCEEMGDLLMQVMLHAQIAEDEGDFTVEDVIGGLSEKLIRRHPHVFGGRDADSSEEAVKKWDEIKKEEKKRKGIDVEVRSILEGVPRELPALMAAYQLQKKAAKVGFDWERVQDVFAKIEEELAEVREARDAEHRREELGDLLFAVANLARFLNIDPEEALSCTNRKFKKRFQYIERRLKEQNKPLEEATLEEMEALWQEAKRL